MAQRLVRTLCRHCRQTYQCRGRTSCRPISHGSRLQQRRQNLYRAVGCRECRGTGYSGRVGIYELLVSDDEIRHLACERTPTNEVKRAAIAAGMRTLRIGRLGQGLPRADHRRRSPPRDQGRLTAATHHARIRLHSSRTGWTECDRPADGNQPPGGAVHSGPAVALSAQAGRPRGCTVWRSHWAADDDSTRVRPEQVATCLSQLSDLLQNGVPLLDSLDLLAEQSPNPALQRSHDRRPRPGGRRCHAGRRGGSASARVLRSDRQHDPSGLRGCLPGRSTHPDRRLPGVAGGAQGQGQGRDGLSDFPDVWWLHRLPCC